MLSVIANSTYATSSVEEADEFTPYRESHHFSFNIPSSYLKNEIFPHELEQYLSKMDDLYEAMANFTGFTDFTAKGKIHINYDPSLDPQTTYARGIRGGNQMTLSWYAIENLVEEISYGNVYWIAVHELGHSFGLFPDFNIEFTADFLALYASVTTGIPLTDWHPRTKNINASLDSWYENEYNWANSPMSDLPTGTLHDTRYSSILTCAIISFVRDYGWEAISKTFQSYHNDSYINYTEKIKYVGTTGAIRFHEFINRIDYFSGTDFRKNYLDYEDRSKELQKEFPVGILGHILGKDKIGLSDALELLKFLRGADSIIARCEIAFEAARITGGSRPNMTDVLEILKYLAGVQSKLD